MKFSLFMILWSYYICYASIVFGGSNDDAKNQGTGLDLNKEITVETSSDHQRSPNQQLNRGSPHVGSSAQTVSHTEEHIKKENMHFRAVQRAKETNTSYQKAYWAIKKEVFLENMRINDPERFNARQETQKSKTKKKNREDRKRWPCNKYCRLLKLRREGKITPQERIELAQQTKKMSEKRVIRKRIEKERQNKTSPEKD